MLANIGVSWLTRLEQGRANRVSAEVLGSIADALRLSDVERVHLHALAGVRSPAARIESRPSDAAPRLLVDGLDPNPAYVLDHAWNLVRWNSAEAALFPVLDRVESSANLLALTLETPELRVFMEDWPEEVARLTQQFRHHLTQYPSDEGDRVVASMRERHGEFEAAWSGHDVARFAPRTRRFLHATVGPLSFDHHRLVLPDHPGWTVVIYTPGDLGTRDRFAAVRRDRGTAAVTPVRGT